MCHSRESGESSTLPPASPQSWGRHPCAGASLWQQVTAAGTDTLLRISRVWLVGRGCRGSCCCCVLPSRRDGAARAVVLPLLMRAFSLIPHEQLCLAEELCLNPAAGLWGQLMPGLWQRGRAALRAGAASQLEGSPRARSLPAGMARDAADRREEGGRHAWLSPVLLG